MTPVISGSWFMKGQFLLHILEHAVYFSQHSKKIHGRKRVSDCGPLFSCKEHTGHILVFQVSVPILDEDKVNKSAKPSFVLQRN